MSINVTVTGNPVSIKRGKMVTSDPYNAKKEFEKRRLLRLEQVRQQSKELAENVRNKVKKEKKKQMGEIEKEGREKLKNWQNRKLLELQNQYRDALDEIGVGHKNAQPLLDEDIRLEEQKIKNEKLAKDRGRAAATKLQIQKNEENYQKAMPTQQKQLVRDIENTRAALVSSVNKKANNCDRLKCKPQNSLANIDITIPNESDVSESLSGSNQLSDIPEEQSEPSDEEYCECSESLQEESSSDHLSRDNEDGVGQSVSGVLYENHNLRNSSKVVQSKPKSYQETLKEHHDKINQFKDKNREVPLDTRISDRIKQRKLMALEPDFCDFDESNSKNHLAKANRLRETNSGKSKGTKINEDIGVKDPLELSSDECLCSKLSKNCPCKAQISDKSDQSRLHPEKYFIRNDHVNSDDVKEGDYIQHLQENNKSTAATEIPSKPAVKLKEVTSSLRSVQSRANEVELQKVRHYDFLNRFEKDVASSSQVEKITADSIEVLPNVVSEIEWQNKIKQWDKAAQIRGRNALEKEKIQKSYEEMIKKLPILQRKQNVAQIGTDKPEYHMSAQRLQDRENEKQARLENAYLKVIPDLKPKLVTLPSRKHDILKPEEPFHILDGDDSRVLNLGKWDTDSKPKTMFSTEEVQEIIKAFTVEKPEDRRAKLKQLLRSLKMQKEQLLNEIRLLPKDDSVNALITDLNSFSEGNERNHRGKKHKKIKRKDIRDETSETDLSNNTAELEQKYQSKTHRKEEKRRKKELGQRQHKLKSGVLVLQNMSTQTTPVLTKQKSSTSTSTSTLGLDTELPIQKNVLKEKTHTCNKLHVPCDCNKENVEGSSEELCKIFIKLHDDNTPQVEVVKSSRSEKDESEKMDGGETGKVEVLQQERKSKSPEKERKSRSPRTHLKQTSPKKNQIINAERISVKETDTNKPKLKKVDNEIHGKSKQRPQNRNESWKEHLSKNSMSTSSTSYMSPPDFSRPNTTASTEASQRSFYNLRKKPQQRNINRSSMLRTGVQPTSHHTEYTDVQLINYIKKLLSMSKISVDELGVSSSEVQTPSQSIIETETNNPLAALHNIVRYINFKAADIGKELNVSPDESHVPPNSLLSESGGSRISKDPGEVIPEKDTPIEVTNQIKDGIISQYTDITDSCTKRIANLAAMINKLREEKIQMLQKSPVEPSAFIGAEPSQINRVITPVSDKDNSTRYFDFPPSGEKSKGTNSTASIDEEELHRRLIDIDMSLAEKLKQFRQSNDEKSKDSSEKSDKSENHREPPLSTDQTGEHLDHLDHDFMNRLQRLIAESYENEDRSSLQLSQPPVQSENEASFVPLLLDIPKLPILEPEPEGQAFGQSTNGLGKKFPPPSKGLIIAKRFNDNISLVPHELSTIAEADSQLSTRMSPNTSKLFTSPVKSVIPELSLTAEPVESLEIDSISRISEKSQETQNKSRLIDEQQESAPQSKPKSPPISDKRVFDARSFKTLDNSDSNKSLTCNDLTCSSACLSSSSLTKQSSSSSSDMETIEAMLRSIGMDWAIPTLHKTQEALALTSSSSSSNVCPKKRNRSKSSSSSEVSLKQFLKKQMLSKISSSSLKSESSPASFLQELSEISAINPNNSSIEKTKRKTSTPVLSSKSTSKSKEEQPLFAGTSDISSVRNTSCDNTTCKKSREKHSFHSLGDEEYSATKSLI